MRLRRLIGVTFAGSVAFAIAAIPVAATAASAPAGARAADPIPVQSACHQGWYVNPDEGLLLPSQEHGGFLFDGPSLVHHLIDPALTLATLGPGTFTADVLAGAAPLFKVETTNPYSTLNYVGGGNWWSSKIPTGPGSQGTPIAAAALVGLSLTPTGTYTNATLVYSFGVGYANDVGNAALVKTITFNGSTYNLACKPPTPDCTVVTHTNTSDVTITDDATATIPSNTLRLKVNTQPAATSWWVNTNVRADEVTDLSYETLKHVVASGGNAAALPAYRLRFDSDGDGDVDATLIYEPYFQISGNPATDTWVEWDVLAGYFWTSATIGSFVHSPGGGYNSVPGGSDFMMNWLEIIAAFPNAKVLGYGLGLGTYNNITDAEVRYLKFAYTGDAAPGACAKHVWAKPPLAETAKTGFNATSWVITGAGLVLAGTLLVLLFRRRRAA